MTTQERKVIELALEALEGFIPYLPLKDEVQCNRYDKAITAIKEALAQPEQEPVAWVCYGSSDSEMHDVDFEQIDVDALPVGTMLYTTTPQRKPLTDEEIAVEKALDNLLYWTERAVNKGNANLDIEEAMQQYNDALAAAHGIKE